MVRVQSRLPTNSGPGDIPGTFPKARARVVSRRGGADPIRPQYLAARISWYEIGARTTASQTHRDLAATLRSPAS
ncbi:MAG TPA: hypothetical protein VLU54_10565 [Casimicrobiaceae bacterium]|nr:hypothetical protein [Casimicrobiaceae bacterium]